ncbi:hypothetical protein Sste5346_005727 [Sporothrix stenoceras]|uniref:Uncharacterized protein n=1 Tax=Sporothrix stenoceras TaxID=5173 RepID=A0ABR3Z3C9_9PEZI
MTGLSDVASLVGGRFVNNLSGSFGSLNIHQWLRLVVIAGAYMLLRPYIIKLGGRIQMKQHEADEKQSLADAVAIANGEKPAMSANDLRDGGAAKKSKVVEAVLGSDAEDESDDEGAVPGAAASGTDWGKNARKRQRRMIRKLLEAHEQQLADAAGDEEDKDIAEFLED